jgi:ParB family transcriptional regulator, chromosome partitioning protein
MEKRKALGRGLQALIPESDSAAVPQELSAENNNGVSMLLVQDINPGQYQPRSAFKQDKLDELIASIKEKGIVQPVLVRKQETGYELIAGERRLRAAKALGIARIPAIIKNAGDLDAIEMALIENIQREDLNPIEEAIAYKRLSAEFNFTQEQIAQAIGKDRASVANTLRLLNLPNAIQTLVADNIIQAGHAKALLAVSDTQKQQRICEKIVRKGLSVREAEFLVRPHAKQRAVSPYPAVQDPHIQNMEDELEKILGTKVVIRHRKKRGKIVIDYFSVDDLNRVISIIISANKPQA